MHMALLGPPSPFSLTSPSAWPSPGYCTIPHKTELTNSTQPPLPAPPIPCFARSFTAETVNSCKGHEVCLDELPSQCPGDSGSAAAAAMLAGNATNLQLTDICKPAHQPMKSETVCAAA